MKKILLTFSFLVTSTVSFSQDSPFNRWSIELGAGTNRATTPYGEGYYLEDETKFLSSLNTNHYEFGVRYMLSNKFGLKLDFNYDLLKNTKDSLALEYETLSYRIGLQGVVNLGRLMQFEDFTSRIGLLGHAGIQVGTLTPQLEVNKEITDYYGGFVFGITPQLRISEKVVLTGDFTGTRTQLQHLNWDGTLSDPVNSRKGWIYSASLGLTFYVGGNDVHADWYAPTALETQDDDARKRLDEIEAAMNDTDKDGVVDYLDTQNNTPAGLVVDSKGRFIDKNQNGVADELESDKVIPDSPENTDGNNSGGGNNNNVVNNNNRSTSSSKAINELMQDGYINIFFDVNKDTPNSGSVNSVYSVINYLKNNPDSKIQLLGFADSKGNEEYNLNLSQRRTENLYNIIVASGIDSSRITIEAKGVDNTYSSDSKVGLALARRVSIVIIE